MSGDIRKFLEEQKLQIFEERKRLGQLKELKENLKENQENVNEIILLEYGKRRKEVLPEQEKKSLDGDKEKGIVWDEDKENRLGKADHRHRKSTGSVLRCTDNDGFEKDKKEHLEFKEYGKRRKEVLPEQEKKSLDGDKEKGIVWDEDKENRLGKADHRRRKSTGSVLRCTDNDRYEKDRKENLEFKEYGKRRKEVLPEQEKKSLDEDKEKGIVWDEDKENRLGKADHRRRNSTESVLRCTNNDRYEKDMKENLEFKEYGKRRKEVLPEQEKKSLDGDKEKGIVWDEDKENRLGKADRRRGKSTGSVLRYTDNDGYEKDKKENLEFKNVPSVVEPLDLTRCCYDLSLEDRKQALIDRFVNSAGPFSSRSDGAVGRAFAGGGVSFAPPTLRRGEYAPSSCSSLRAAPHEGLGEYEIGRGLFQERRKRDYLRHLAKKNHDTLREVVQENVEGRREEAQKSTRSTNTEISVSSKIVQTDIQNINNELVVHYDNVRPFAASPEKRVTQPQRTVTDELVDAALRSTKRLSPFRVDQRLTSAQNDLLFLRAGSAAQPVMDKPKGILSNRRTGSPRDRYTSDLGQTSYTPNTFLDGFSYTNRTDELERERLKRDTYQRELRLQIEEKRHLQAMRDDQERRERELANKRLEQQLLHMHEELMVEDQRTARRNDLMRRHSDDLLRRKTEMHELQRPWRRHADSESGNLDSFGLRASPTTATYGGATSGSHYSPPVSRRGAAYSSYNVPATSVFPETNSSRYNHPSRYDASCSTSSTYGGGILRKDTLKRIESLNSYDTVPLRSSQQRRFDRFDSLSRIDSLSHRLETMSVRDGDLSDVQRRHSATQQDLSHLRKSPRLRRRNSSSRFEDSLPVPVLKARSPVAKELKNAIPFSSHRSGEVQRRLEDRWQIPAVQKTILHPAESPSRGSILTQLGSIRAQLQREQLRMDESLRRRGLVRTRTTEDY